MSDFTVGSIQTSRFQSTSNGQLFAQSLRGTQINYRDIKPEKINQFLDKAQRAFTSFVSKKGSESQETSDYTAALNLIYTHKDMDYKKYTPDYDFTTRSLVNKPNAAHLAEAVNKLIELSRSAFQAGDSHRLSY